MYAVNALFTKAVLSIVLDCYAGPIGPDNRFCLREQPRSVVNHGQFLFTTYIPVKYGRLAW